MAEKTGSRRKTVDKWKKKKWFTITASKLFDNKILAETPAEKPINISGRTMRVGLDRLTGQRIRKDTLVYFKTMDVQGQNINTRISKFELTKSSVGRLIRRGNSKIMVSEKIPVVGGEARITLIAVTARKATGSQKTGINKIMRNHLNELRGKEFEEVVKELIFGKLTRTISDDAKKIFLVKKVLAFKAVFVESK